MPYRLIDNPRQVRTLSKWYPKPALSVKMSRFPGIERSVGSNHIDETQFFKPFSKEDEFFSNNIKSGNFLKSLGAIKNLIFEKKLF